MPYRPCNRVLACQTTFHPWVNPLGLAQDGHHSWHLSQIGNWYMTVQEGNIFHVFSVICFKFSRMLLFIDINTLFYMYICAVQKSYKTVTDWTLIILVALPYLMGWILWGGVFLCSCSSQQNSQVSCKAKHMTMLWVVFIMFWFHTELSTCWFDGDR